MFAEMEHHGTRCLHLMHDPESGLKAIIAIHSLARGPAIGGCRFISYPNEQSALEDALRLARGMSYKAALADLPHGGAKAVIIQPNQPFNRQQLMQCFGQMVDSLNGAYITAMDSGTRVTDMDIIRSQTRWVSCTKQQGDPSPYTAKGVMEAIRTTVAFRSGSRDLNGLTVALQGVGHVGMAVAQNLHADGARLIISDVDEVRAHLCAERFNAEIVSPDSLYDVKADLFCPCGLGAILNTHTLPRLRVNMVVGSANNQLADDSIASLLQQKGILYAPDFLVNAGGLIFVALQYAGETLQAIEQKIQQIGTMLQNLYLRSITTQLSPHLLALEQARMLLKQAEQLHTAA
ncbi:Glu/Leu/Phe/Val dehydrogenase dimerization domain-containing protein [Neptuniibacter sp. CAU 1671]|uniref:Leu/Phe/Val dehydrogenase n=1 Tax=Neptuniibacter sp. CAU 1671 TaxID=3032593 RepID=UPI0023DB32A7|nr:Glu/Leu/Phe/Val dehydrogenase dimerization domain-containing protein [Neptuniibacter sp. CAU 1671]MDF2182253.1 Glu/Leu/Phe/Val dehydrogenase dimerization domain-containing protein [Neptuniibacter sp. CAU 1671]